MKVENKPLIKSLRNTGLVFLFILWNALFQIYCRPVWWAEILAIICLVWTAIKPLVKDRIPSIIRIILSSITSLFWGYCLFFILTDSFSNLWEYRMVLGTVLWGVLCWMEWREIKNKSKKLESAIYWMINIMLVFGIIFTGVSYSKTAKELCVEKINEPQTEVSAYWKERIVGMHFIYHTRVCYFDGWRPPKLDPLLTIALALNHYEDPLGQLSLKQRLQLYKELYPNRPYKFKCACTLFDSEIYQQDSLWEE